MFTLQLFGGCAIVSSGEAITGKATQRRRLALLVVVASSPAGVSRDKLVAYFWPEDDRERARHFLADSLFTLRKSLGKDALLTTSDDVRVNPQVIDSDVARFDTLVEAGELAEAAALYRGPFLDGFFIADAPEFERWTERERDRLARRMTRCLEQLANQLETGGDWSSAAETWRRLSTHDPYNSRVALRAMRALEESGDVAGALQHARTHQARIRDELGLASDPAVVELADRLRVRPAPPPAAVTPLSTAAMTTHAEAGEWPPAIPSAAAPSDAIRERHLTPSRAVVTAAMMVTAAALILSTHADRGGELLSGATASRNASAASGSSTSRDALGTRTRRDEASDLYAQGRYALTKGQFDPEIHQRALELFHRAAERDSTFAPAYAGMADVYNHADEPARAKEAAIRAISLDSSLAEAHTALSYVLAFYEYRWADADSALHRAIRLNPRYVLAYLRRANVLVAQGRFDEAEAVVERAREVQPESFVVMLNRAMIADLRGRGDEAIARYRAALVLEPGRIDAQFMLTRAYWAQGRYAEAQEVMRSLGNIAGVAAMSGNRDTMALLAPLLASGGRSDSIRHAAAIYARLGRPVEAIAQLERLYERRDKHLTTIMQQQVFASLREHPRFVRLLRKVNLPAPSAR